jgi:hypothetical protein
MSSFHRAPLFAGSSKAEKKRELINYHIVMSQHWLVKQENPPLIPGTNSPRTGKQIGQGYEIFRPEIICAP